MLSTLLLCPELPAQNASDSRSIVKPDPKRAKKLADQGAKDETAGNFPQALAEYEEASRYAPFDVIIAGKGAALRSRLVRAYVERAERAALDSNFQTATEALASALSIDPGNTIVLERLRQMQTMKEGADKLPAEEPAEGLVTVQAAKTTRNFNLHADVRSVYEQVAAAYGLKAAFDPDLPTRNVKLHLQGAEFETAMRVLTAQTGTFWRPVNAKLIFVAADTAEKRRTFEQELEQTFVLPSSTDASEMTELVRVIRELTASQHIQQSLPSHSITIRDTVQRVRLAGAIIRGLEQERGEVLLEVDLVEVDHATAAKLGITPPANLKFHFVSPTVAGQLRSAPNLSALLTILATIFGTPVGGAAAGGIASLASSIPPVASLGGGKSTFLLELPSVSADFSQGLSLVQSGRQILMRAQDGKPATFFVGDRFPITLSLLSGSLGSTNFTANPGGTGITIPSQTFTVGQGPVALLSADFRTIGTLDLAVLNQIDNSITILLNQGSNATPQFAAATGSPISLGAARATAPARPAAMATGSLNSNTDSLPDLLVTDPVANTVSVLLENSTADGRFTLQTKTIAVGKEPSAIATGAFHSQTDKNIGFVVTNFADNTYSVFLGDGNGGFTAATGSPFALGAGEQGPRAVAVDDFNGDGVPDLAIVNESTNNVAILLGDGSGKFTEATNSPIAVGKGPVAIASGALAGSTGPALAVVNQQDNTLTVLLGNGDGTFQFATKQALATSAAPSAVAIGSFLQGLNGIAVANRDAGTVAIYADLGSGVFTNALEQSVGTNPVAIVTGAFTGQTFPDVAVANDLSSGDGTVTLLVSPTSLVSNPALSQQPYPGSEYVDIGIKVKATPSLHENNEVTLQLDFDIKSLAGSSVNGIPVISNRALTQTIRLKEEETSMIAGLLDREETQVITGLPGFANLPGAGYAFGSHSSTFKDNELLILITPRKVRAATRDGRLIYAGRGEPGTRGSAGANVPLPPQPQAEPAPQLPPQTPPQPQPPPAAPPQGTPPL